MAKDFSTMEDSNRSSNPSIHDISQPSRRTMLCGSLGALASNFLAPLSAAGGAAALAGVHPALAEALTRKEIRVLQLLAEGYSNSAMAEKLFVSDSTVRTHLRNINLKLDARSRTQAVAIARRLGLMR